MSRILTALGLCSALSLVPLAAQANRPPELPPGAILTITQAGCGFAGCTFDTTTFFHDGRWVRSSSNLAEPCVSERDERMSPFARQDLRDVEHALRPWAAANALFIPTCNGCADTQEFSLQTVHGTIGWGSGAEFPESESGMPPEVAAAIDAIWTAVHDTTEVPCFTP